MFTSYICFRIKVYFTHEITRLKMGDVKNELDVKSENLELENQEENRLLKDLYAQLFQSITEANLSSLRSIELAQQLSSIREVREDDVDKQFHEVITPLKNTVVAFGLSLGALHIIGKANFINNILICIIILLKLKFYISIFKNFDF